MITPDRNTITSTMTHCCRDVEIGNGSDKLQSHEDKGEVTAPGCLIRVKETDRKRSQWGQAGELDREGSAIQGFDWGGYTGPKAESILDHVDIAGTGEEDGGHHEADRCAVDCHLVLQSIHVLLFRPYCSARWIHLQTMRRRRTRRGRRRENDGEGDCGVSRKGTYIS